MLTSLIILGYVIPAITVYLSTRWLRRLPEDHPDRFNCGMSIWMMVILFIPLLNIIFALVLTIISLVIMHDNNPEVLERITDKFFRIKR